MSTVDVFERCEGAAGTGARWPLHVAFAVTVTGFCAFYAATFVSLISTWARTGRYQYAFLILPVCVVLIWLRRDTLRRLTAAPKPLGLAPLCLLCLLWLAGTAAHVNLVTQFVVIAMIPSLIFTFYGSAITRALMFPLAFLFFAVPFGNFLVGPLQDITAWLSVAALQWTSVPVLLEGHYIMTPASTWHVAEACSGVSFFFATTAFGVLYANLFFRRWRRRLFFIVLALITPIVANGLRVFFTILIGEYFGIQYATGTDHMIFGWQFFGAVLVLLFLVGWPWHEMEAAAPDVNPHKTARHSHSGGAQSAGLAVVTLFVLAAAPLWMATNHPRSASGPVQPLALPETLGGLPYAAPIAAESAANPGTKFKNPDTSARARYGRANHFVNVTIATYAGVPSVGNELVAFGNRLFNGDIWKLTTGSSAPIGTFQELQLVRRRDKGRWLLWYFYRVGEQTTASAGVVKFWQAWNRVLGRSKPARVVTLATPISGEKRVARRRLEVTAGGLLAWLSANRETGQP